MASGFRNSIDILEGKIFETDRKYGIEVIIKPKKVSYGVREGNRIYSFGNSGW